MEIHSPITSKNRSKRSSPLLNDYVRLLVSMLHFALFELLERLLRGTYGYETAAIYALKLTHDICSELVQGHPDFR